MSYYIFADVSIDIDKDYAAEHDIHYVPMEYVLGDDTFHCEAPENDSMMHEYYDILASVMLLFYGLALVNVSKFTYSSIVWLGYAFICLGVVDCFWEGHSLLFWTIGFGGFHILYGILFYLHYERKRS